MQYLEHIIHQTRCSVDHKILVILDNHESHCSLAAVDLAKRHGIVLLTIPPHTSHKLQPLDRTCYGPFKVAYSRSLDGWMRSNAGKTVTIYDIPELVNEAQLSAIVPRNVISCFRNTGIYPYNMDIFNETDYAPSAITDRELSEEPNANVAELNANAAEPTANAAESNVNAAEPNANKLFLKQLWKCPKKIGTLFNRLHMFLLPISFRFQKQDLERQMCQHIGEVAPKFLPILRYETILRPHLRLASGRNQRKRLKRLCSENSRR